MNLLRDYVLLQRCRLRTALQVRVRWLRDDSGSALVEMAFMLALVGVPLLLGTAHYASLLISSIAVSNAAHAGAEYGMQSSTYAGDTSFIQAAAQDDSGMGTKLTVTPTVFWACSLAISGTQYTSDAAAIAGCTSANGNALEFIQVVASAVITPAARVPWAPNSVTLSSTSVMEVQE